MKRLNKTRPNIEPCTVSQSTLMCDEQTPYTSMYAVRSVNHDSRISRKSPGIPFRSKRFMSSLVLMKSNAGTKTKRHILRKLSEFEEICMHFFHSVLSSRMPALTKYWFLVNIFGQIIFFFFYYANSPLATRIREWKNKRMKERVSLWVCVRVFLCVCVCV